MNAHDLITIDPDILGGTPVFKGTRVPVKTIFDYLEANYTLEEFLECFPSVTRDMACRLLERSEPSPYPRRHRADPGCGDCDPAWRLSALGNPVTR